MGLKIVFPRTPPGQRPQVKIEAIGFTGPGCEAVTQKLRDAIGVTTQTEHKPEYYEPDTNEVEVQQEGNGA